MYEVSGKDKSGTKKQTYLFFNMVSWDLENDSAQYINLIVFTQTLTWDNHCNNTFEYRVWDKHQMQIQSKNGYWKKFSFIIVIEDLKFKKILTKSYREKGNSWTFRLEDI